MIVKLKTHRVEVVRKQFRKVENPKHKSGVKTAFIISFNQKIPKKSDFYITEFSANTSVHYLMLVQKTVHISKIWRTIYEVKYKFCRSTTWIAKLWHANIRMLRKLVY